MHFRYLTLIVTTMLFLLSCGCGGRGAASATQNQTLTNEPTINSNDKSSDKAINHPYRVVKNYPHSVTSYTQGLFWHDGYLWESTGEFGRSALKKVDLESSATIQNLLLGESYFGEGTAILDGYIYQLTWMNETAFVYDAKTLKLVRKISYSGQGWGITSDGKSMYMSNGTDEIKIVDPLNFEVQRRINVRMNNRRVREVNELEWIGGKIWANIYLSDMVIIIDPTTGIVDGYLDLKDLLPESDRLPSTDVLNGIAYDPEGDRIFVTGKNWSKLFEISLTK